MILPDVECHVQVLPDDTTPSLTWRLFEIGAGMLIRHMPAILSGNAARTATPQDDSAVTHAHKVGISMLLWAPLLAQFNVFSMEQPVMLFCMHYKVMCCVMLLLLQLSKDEGHLDMLNCNAVQLHDKVSESVPPLWLILHR